MLPLYSKVRKGRFKNRATQKKIKSCLRLCFKKFLLDNIRPFVLISVLALTLVFIPVLAPDYDLDFAVVLPLA